MESLNSTIFTNTSIHTIDTKINVEEIIFGFLSLVGTLTSVVNTLMFWKLRFKDQVYKYYLISSIFDTLYMFSIFLYTLIACGYPCEKLNKNGLIKFIYLIAVYDYLTSCIAIYNILIEIFVTTQRYFLISRKKTLQNLNPNLVMFITILVSLLYYSPIVFLKKICFTANIGFTMVYTNFGLSEVGRLVPIVLSSIRLILASVILLIANIFTLIEFKKYLKQKRLMKFSNLNSNLNSSYSGPRKQVKDKKMKNVTQMLISIAFVYSIGTLPYALYYGLSELFKTNNFIIDKILYSFGGVGFRLIIILKILIFYKYNKIFQEEFRLIVKKLWEK
ncbi:hypothetical protein BpHYR1_052027 [Brachionus plicatilis]|uniref:G-protein coupled receptors family 1 profile domain-containing protein n=1 Tax=Brachionus plicatilis TaxID=10195 RepID=A0A3M7PZQ7_BRAPC|nr:hypothetical protein BpHYR1_052027 [Brachionus plicatilis]